MVWCAGGNELGIEGEVLTRAVNLGAWTGQPGRRGGCFSRRACGGSRRSGRQLGRGRKRRRENERRPPDEARSSFGVGYGRHGRCWPSSKLLQGVGRGTCGRDRAAVVSARDESLSTASNQPAPAQDAVRCPFAHRMQCSPALCICPRSAGQLAASKASHPSSMLDTAWRPKQQMCQAGPSWAGQVSDSDISRAARGSPPDAPRPLGT